MLQYWGNSYGFKRLWTPQDLSSWVQLFIADSNSVSVDGSSGVSQLNDLSGNGYHATQSTSANRPIWSATSFGGAAGISGGNFPGQLLTHTAPQPGIALSTFVVATNINLSPAYAVLYCSEAPNAQMRMNWYMRYVGSSKVTLAHVGTTNTNPTLAASTSYVLTATNSAAGTSPSTYNCRTNAVSGITVTSPIYAGDTLDRRCIFDESPTGGTTCQAILGACGYINRVLSTAELQLLEGWAAWKYNFVGNLPAGHPYKSAAPTI